MSSKDINGQKPQNDLRESITRKRTGIIDSYGVRKQGVYENGREKMMIIILNNA
jgi:hypothetical protein